MNRTAILMVGLVLPCCGGSAGDDDATDEGPTSCDPATDRQGTYLLHFTETGGNCGPSPDQIVRLGEVAPGTSCTNDYEPIVSEAGCKVEASVTCVDGATGQSGHSVGVTTQEDESGAHLSGVATITIKDAQGTELCLSTYRLTYTRQ